ncbi:MAG: hypothetical protein QNK31_14035 [Porticoccus sp.]|nr:hypothetical protein [Porticoccus sp.]
MIPNNWNLKGQLRSLDVNSLWSRLEEICSPKNNLFPKAIDSITWVTGNKDHQIRENHPINELKSLKEKIPLTDGNFYIRLYHKKITDNLKIELIPEYFIDLSIDSLTRQVSLSISTVGQGNANNIAEKVLTAVEVTTSAVPEHHKYLESFINNLLLDYPDYEKNVFLIMRFRDEKPFPEIVSTLKDLCEDNGLNLLRADDREYTSDLWDNVMTYMYSCSSAIAVFDEINYREFNPNVALEVGFMLSKGRPVLLLKDQAISAMPTDIIGKTYRPFNTYDPLASLPPQVIKWINDYGLKN